MPSNLLHKMLIANVEDRNMFQLPRTQKEGTDTRETTS